MPTPAWMSERMKRGTMGRMLNKMGQPRANPDRTTPVWSKGKKRRAFKPSPRRPGPYRPTN